MCCCKKTKELYSKENTIKKLNEIKDNGIDIYSSLDSYLLYFGEHIKESIKDFESDELTDEDRRVIKRNIISYYTVKTIDEPSSVAFSICILGFLLSYPAYDFFKEREYGVFIYLLIIGIVLVIYPQISKKKLKKFYLKQRFVEYLKNEYK